MWESSVINSRLGDVITLLKTKMSIESLYKQVDPHVVSLKL